MSISVSNAHLRYTQMKGKKIGALIMEVSPIGLREK